MTSLRMTLSPNASGSFDSIFIYVPVPNAGEFMIEITKRADNAIRVQKKWHKIDRYKAAIEAFEGIGFKRDIK